jgi:hypothetical protein
MENQRPNDLLFVSWVCNRVNSNLLFSRTNRQYSLIRVS